MTMKLVKTVFLKAPRAHVWRFLTEKDKLALWFHAAATDVTPGGDYTLLTNSYGKDGDKLVWGKVLEMAPPAKLVHTFTHNMLKGVETICAWELAEFDGGTMLTLDAYRLGESRRGRLHHGRQSRHRLGRAFRPPAPRHNLKSAAPQCAR